MSELSNRYGDNEIAKAAIQPLETWENLSSRYVIHLEHPEFTSLCPRSGYPDFGTIVVDYVPGSLVVELKAFKLFINSFRDKRISHENVTNQIADELNRQLNPIALRVIGDFSRRGGVKTVITAWRGDEFTFPQYTQNIL